MRFLFMSLCFGITLTCFSQIMAITDTGDKVILYSDGRWTYAERDSVQPHDIPTNPKKFTKNKKADFLLKSTQTPAGFWLDPSQWTFTRQEGEGAAEYELDHKNGSLYALIIAEHLDLPLTALGNIALQNARQAAPDIRITAKEFRNVNGNEILMMRMVGTIQDIRFSYFGYYYSSNGIAVQYLAYSSETFMEENVSIVEDLLNGFVSQAK